MVVSPENLIIFIGDTASVTATCAGQTLTSAILQVRLLSSSETVKEISGSISGDTATFTVDESILDTFGELDELVYRAVVKYNTVVDEVESNGVIDDITNEVATENSNWYTLVFREKYINTKLSVEKEVDEDKFKHNAEYGKSIKYSDNLKLVKSDNILTFPTVDIDHPLASKVKVETADGVKSLVQNTPNFKQHSGKNNHRVQTINRYNRNAGYYSYITGYQDVSYLNYSYKYSAVSGYTSNYSPYYAGYTYYVSTTGTKSQSYSYVTQASYKYVSGHYYTYSYGYYTSTTYSYSKGSNYSSKRYYYYVSAYKYVSPTYGYKYSAKYYYKVGPTKVQYSTRYREAVNVYSTTYHYYYYYYYSWHIVAYSYVKSGTYIYRAYYVSPAVVYYHYISSYYYYKTSASSLGSYKYSVKHNSYSTKATTYGYKYGYYYYTYNASKDGTYYKGNYISSYTTNYKYGTKNIYAYNRNTLYGYHNTASNEYIVKDYYGYTRLPHSFT